MPHNLLTGKKGIIFGALDPNSIAWVTAERVFEEGGVFVLTNAPVALRMGQINELAKKTNSKVIPADATSLDDLQNLVQESMKILGGKWKLPILHRLMDGKMRFSALYELIPSLSRKVLSDQLKQLEKDGLVIRKKYSQIPPKVEYSLTNQAIKLKPIIEFLSGWNKEISETD